MTAPAWKGGEFHPRPVTAEEMRTRLFQDIDNAATYAARRTHQRLPYWACHEGARDALTHYLLGDLPERLAERLDDRAREWSFNPSDEPSPRRERLAVFKHVASKLLPTFAHNLAREAPPYGDGEHLAPLGPVSPWSDAPSYWQRGARRIPGPKIEQRLLREELDEMQRVDDRTADALRAFMRGSGKLGEDEDMTKKRGAAEMFGKDDVSNGEYRQYVRVFNRGTGKLRERITIVVESMPEA